MHDRYRDVLLSKITMLKTPKKKTQTFARTANTLIASFADMADPRTRQDIVRYPLLEIIFIAVCGIFAGAEGPTAIEKWAKLNKKELKKYLKLKSGIPSHDRIRDILRTIDPKEFQNRFVAWTKSIVMKNKSLSSEQDGVSLAEKTSSGETPPQIAIDGKQRRRSRSKKMGISALDVVSAWSTEHGISLGQTTAEEKSNEIKAIPELLRLLNFEGSVITIDAAGTQKSIAKQIIVGGGDYVLGLKGNQGNLHKNVAAYFADLDLNSKEVSFHEERDKGHGREEHREYWHVNVPKKFAESEKWTGLRSFGMVRRTYTDGDGKTKCETRYFICSISRNAKELARLARGHWGIENSLHWVLDMTFREDESQVRERRLGENLSWLNRVAVSLLRQHPSNTSVKLKQKSCAWSVDFLMQVLTGQYD